MTAPEILQLCSMHCSRGGDIAGNRATSDLSRIWHSSEADDKQSMNNWASGDISDEETKRGGDVEGAVEGMLLHVRTDGQMDLLWQDDIWVTRENARAIHQDGENFCGRSKFGSRKPFLGDMLIRDVH